MTFLVTLSLADTDGKPPTKKRRPPKHRGSSYRCGSEGQQGGTEGWAAFSAWPGRAMLGAPKRSLSDQAAAAGEQGREMEKLDVMRKWTKRVVENKRTKIKHHWIVTVESGKGTWLLSPRSPDNGWLSWKSFGKLPIVKVATNGPARWSRGRARNLFSHTNPLL